MKLLSHDRDRLVFHLNQKEVDGLRRLVELGLSASRRPIRLSHAPEALPPNAVEDFTAALAQQQLANRRFLAQVFGPGSTQLQPAGPGRKGYGLTLTPAEVEQVLQTLNDLKLAHWERLGCPEFDADEAPELDPAHFSSLWLMDAVNELQMLFLRALASPD